MYICWSVDRSILQHAQINLTSTYVRILLLLIWAAVSFQSWLSRVRVCAADRSAKTKQKIVPSGMPKAPPAAQAPLSPSSTRTHIPTRAIIPSARSFNAPGKVVYSVARNVGEKCLRCARCFPLDIISAVGYTRSMPSTTIHTHVRYLCGMHDPPAEDVSLQSFFVRGLGNRLEIAPRLSLPCLQSEPLLIFFLFLFLFGWETVLHPVSCKCNRSMHQQGDD